MKERWVLDIHLRTEIGTDRYQQLICGGGWWVDDVEVGYDRRYRRDVDP